MKKFNTLLILVFTAFTLTACGHSSGSAPDLSSTGGSNDNPSPTSTTTTCAGSLVAGACWYASAVSGSCTTACTSNGGYSSATETLAGSAGTDTVCGEVLDALNLQSGLGVTDVTGNGAVGCFASHAPVAASRDRATDTPATASASLAHYVRACACTM